MIESKKKYQTSIRTKIIIAMSICFFLMFAVLYIVFYTSMQKMLIEKEYSNMLNQVKLAKNILMSSVSHLPSTTRDWSSWDNTYDFVLGKYDEFLDNYLTEYPFQLFRLNFLTILDEESNIVYEKFYDFRNSRFIDNKPDLKDLYKKIGAKTISSFKGDISLDLTNTTEIGAVGFVSYKNESYYMSSYPIIHSDETGPAVGSFIFGRIIDKEEIDYLTIDYSLLNFSLLSQDEFKIDKKQKSMLLKNEGLVLAEKDKITAYDPFADILGSSNLLISITNPRVLYEQGNSFIRIILIIVAICCALVLISTIITLNRIVIKPFGLLVKEVNEINIDTVSKPLDIKSKNKELEKLTAAINDMLYRIKMDRDIIEANNNKLYYNANHDILTGLRNRFNIEKALEDAIVKAKEDLTKISVFFIDLDHFKFINDTLGHRSGNNLIINIANKIIEHLGNNSMIARMGGDEFLIVVENLGDKIKINNYIETIFDIFKAPFFVKEREIAVNASVGSSTYPDDGQDAETLIKNAEVAMYKAKEVGKNLYISYKKEFHIELQKRIYIENKIRTAINDGCKEFKVLFQPKFSTETGKIIGCEALIRWLSPEGTISPLEFIPRAEESGLIVPLSWWVIKECCSFGAKIKKEGIPGSIAINVSAQVLLHEDFLLVINDAVKETGIDIKNLDIEITESTLLDDIKKVNIILHKLHELGIEISVDDFGTGYSSLSYLNKLSVDRIKIDRSFITRISETDENKAIISAIIAMAKSLRMVVTAEGVETKLQYNFLKDLKCEEIQGYFISKPLSGDEYIEFVKKYS